MQHKYALILIPALFIIAYGLYWFWRKRSVSRHYFSAPIANLAKENTNYRQVLYTTKKSQLTLMAIASNDEIPTEIHDVDQIFVIVEGQGEAIIDGTITPLSPEALLIVPAGTEHTIKNSSSTPLKLYTIYAPPEHPAGSVHKNRSDEPRH